MILCPPNSNELTSLLAGASARGEKISTFDLRALNRVLEHKAEDMTARVEAGVTLAALQANLAARGQWLPIDPPNPEQLTIGALLATSHSGPRRFGYGTVRDYLIGLTVVLADGRVIHSGGNVVKNVAGYDLLKLFIGSRGSLGVIVEAIFKLRPLPEAETFVQARRSSLDEADKMIETVLDSGLTPVVFDLHNLRSDSGGSIALGLGASASLPASFQPRTSPAGMVRAGLATALPVLVLGFAGTREELEWQLVRAAELGIAEPSSLDYAKAASESANSFHTISVLPSKMIETLRGLDSTSFIARAGNGIIYCVGPQAGDPAVAGRSGFSAGVRNLGQRLKDEFDPKHILPDSPL